MWYLSPKAVHICPKTVEMESCNLSSLVGLCRTCCRTWTQHLWTCTTELCSEATLKSRKKCIRKANIVTWAWSEWMGGIVEAIFIFFPLFSIYVLFILIASLENKWVKIYIFSLNPNLLNLTYLYIFLSIQRQNKDNYNNNRYSLYF